MRHFLDALPRLAVGIATIVLLVTALVLREGAGTAYDRRDAFATQIQTGQRTLSVPSIAGEWRQEIAAQQMTARRDLLLSEVLLGTALFVFCGFAAPRLPGLLARNRARGARTGDLTSA